MQAHRCGRSGPNDIGRFVPDAYPGVQAVFATGLGIAIRSA